MTAPTLTRNLHIELPPLHSGRNTLEGGPTQGGQVAVANSPARFIVCICGRRYGKALAVDTPIRTPNGWKLMGDIQVGDYVYGSDGFPVKVLETTDFQYGRECYKVTFSDGSFVISDKDHLWTVSDKSYRKNMARGYRKVLKTLTTYQMIDSLKVGKENNYQITITKPLQAREQLLPIDPYVLGAWLGDGTSGTADITSDDPEIIDRIRSCGYLITVKAYYGKTTQYRIGGYGESGLKRSDTTGRYISGICLQSELQSMNLIQNKHIPEKYLLASYDQRQALLEGLMDTDGYAEKNGSCEYCSVDERLANDVLELVLSLGHRAKLSVNNATLNGKFVSLKYRVMFTPTSNVFSLKRKADKVVCKNIYNTARSIVSITPVESVPVKCIQVDSFDSLYLAGRNLIPTHNTVVGIHKCCRGALSKPGTVYFWVGPNYPEITISRAWPTLKALVSQIPGSEIRESDRMVIFPNKSEIWIKSADNPDSLRGGKLSGVVLDEVAQIKEETWTQVLRPALMDLEGWALFIGTPRGKNWVYHLYEKADKLAHWARFKSSTYDNPYISVAEINAMREEMSELEFQQEVMADFGSSSYLVFPEFDRSIHKWTKPVPKFHRYFGGLDFGGDSVGNHKSAGAASGIDAEDNMIILRVFEQSGPNIGERQLNWVFESNILVERLCRASVSPVRQPVWCADKTQMLGIEFMRKMGVNIVKSKGGADSVMEGLELIHRRLQLRNYKPRLYYLPECHQVPDAFERYHNNEPDPNKYVPSNPVKIEDDLMDAIRYMVEKSDRSFVGDPARLFAGQLGGIR